MRSAPMHPRSRARRGVLGLAGLAVLALLGSGCAWIVPASVDADGNFGSGSSQTPALSGDGRFVAFRSTASDLVPGDGNGVADIFVRDNLTGEIERASIDSAGVEADRESSAPHLSADGRYVAFRSLATNLAAGAPPTGSKVFVRDRVADTTELVSVVTGRDPYISGDGRYVVYDDLVEVYVHDRVAGTTEVVPPEPGYVQSRPSISDDGRYVAFGKDTPFSGGIWPLAFVYDRETGQTEELTSFPDQSAAPVISGDGTTVVHFEAVPRGTPGNEVWEWSLVVADLGTGESRVFLGGSDLPPSVLSLGRAGVSVSSDGERIAAHTGRSLVPEDTNGHRDIYLFDKAGQLSRQIVSTNATGELASAAAQEPALSGDGRTVAFESAATNLAPASTSNVDVYVRAVPQPEVESATPAVVVRGETVEVEVTGEWFDPDASVAVGGGGVQVDDVVFVSATELRVTVSVAADAKLSPRPVLVNNPGMGGAPEHGTGAVCVQCLDVADP